MTINVIALARVNPDHKEAAQNYSAGAKLVVESFGGKPVGRFTTMDKIVGEGAPQITLMMEFSDSNQVKACFESEAYLALVPMRDQGFLDMQIYMAE